MGLITFKNLMLFDGKSQENLAHAWITVDQVSGRIQKIGNGDLPSDIPTIDLNGQYVMPGFINVHTHISLDPQAFDGGFGKSQVETTVLAYQHLRELLKSGVTFIRECGCLFDLDIELSKMQQKGLLTDVPTIMPSGRLFVMTGGHGDAPGAAYQVDSPDEMRKAVRQGLKNGAQNIKMVATGGVMTPSDFMDDPQLSTEEMTAGVIEAHHKHKRVSVHAEGNPGIQNALDAHADSIEHGFYVTAKEAQQMVEQDTYLTPTLIAEWVIPKYGKNKIPSWELNKAADALDDTYKNLTRAYQLGVKFTCGTDAGTVFNGFDQTPAEFELLTKLGMTPAQAYQCSSINSAELCQIQADYGTLETGKFADFIVLKNNPLEDVKAVQQTDKQVYLHGLRQF
jgi:imidazolonepropionase-like amidohydrolase